MNYYVTVNEQTILGVWDCLGLKYLSVKFFRLIFHKKCISKISDCDAVIIVWPKYFGGAHCTLHRAVYLYCAQLYRVHA